MTALAGLVPPALVGITDAALRVAAAAVISAITSSSWPQSPHWLQGDQQPVMAVSQFKVRHQAAIPSRLGAGAGCKPANPGQLTGSSSAAD